MKRLLMVALVATMAGCSGLELGGRLGVYAVDEKQDSSRTYRRQQPLKCLFVSCEEPTKEVEGS